MRSPIVAFLLLATLGTGPVVPAQVSAEGDGYRIKLKYVEGQKTRYSAVTEVSMTGGPEGLPAPQKTEITIDQEVVSVKDGVATLKVTTTGGPEGTAGEQTMKVDEKGQVIGKDNSSVGGLPSPLPDRPLKVDEEWSAEVTPPGLGADMGQMKVDYKFLGLKEYGEGEAARPAAQIDFKMSMAARMPLEGSGSIHIDPLDGQMLASKVKTVMTMNLPGSTDPLTVTMNMEMKRLARVVK